MKQKILNYLKENSYLDNVLLVSVVGSRMWQMEHEGSDWDIFIVVNTSLKEMLSINYHSINKEFKCELDGVELDIKIKEIKDVLKQLYKNNPNFIFGVLSDNIIYESNNELMKELRAITYRNINYQIFPPLNGMMVHHYQKYFVNNVHDKSGKKEIVIRKIALLYRLLTNMERKDLPLIIPPHLKQLEEMNKNDTSKSIIDGMKKFKIGDLIDFVTDTEYPRWSAASTDINDFNQFLLKLKYNINKN